MEEDGDMILDEFKASVAESLGDPKPKKSRKSKKTPDRKGIYDRIVDLLGNVVVDEANETVTLSGSSYKPLSTAHNPRREPSQRSVIECVNFLVVWTLDDEGFFHGHEWRDKVPMGEIVTSVVYGLYDKRS